jgi:hypothetical protein
MEHYHLTRKPGGGGGRRPDPAGNAFALVQSDFQLSLLGTLGIPGCPRRLILATLSCMTNLYYRRDNCLQVPNLGGDAGLLTHQPPHQHQGTNRELFEVVLQSVAQRGFATINLFGQPGIAGVPATSESERARTSTNALCGGSRPARPRCSHRF